jgi:cell division protein ZapB
MSDVKVPNVELATLELRVDELLKTIERLEQDNDGLRHQHTVMSQERATLIEKTEVAKSRVEAMIARLKAMES